MRFVLTIMEPERALSSGMEGTCRFRMADHPDFAHIATEIAPGVKFKLSQGPIPLGTGIVNSVKERNING
jgi:hypothetical protein